MISCWRWVALIPLLWCMVVFSQEALHAAITSQGDVAPVPPAGGGSITGPLRVGSIGLGTMHIGGGTPLTSTSNAFVGDGSAALGVVTLSGLGSNWTLSTLGADLTVGVDGTGSLSLADFARVVVPDDTTLGDDFTGIGELNIADLGTAWNTGNLFAGESGLGIANIVGGGQLISGSSTLGNFARGEGRVTIADALSLWRVDGSITVGAAGRGSLSILDGGTLRTTSLATLGNALGSVGVVEVNGAGALWDIVDGGVVVGSAGAGKLQIFNGGLVASRAANISLASTTGSRGEIWVDGLGSSLTVSGSINSGVSESQLTISAGGEVIATSLTWGTTGRMNLQNGRLKVTNASGFSSSGLIAGSGVIETNSFVNAQSGSIRGRVQVAAGEHLRVTNTMANTGLVDLDGGELEVGGALTNNFDIDARNGAILRVGGLGLDNNNGAQLAITAGEVDVFGAVDNNTGGQILVGNGASGVFHDTVTNNGDLVVLAGSTLLAVEQLNLLGNQSNLSLQLTANDAFADTAPVQAAGQIILEGDLTVTLASGYQPQAGDVFPVLASDTGLAGVFFNENLPGPGAGLDWDILRTANSLSLLVLDISDLPGDFDRDGDVDGRDFLLWQRNPSVGDLADWQANYGVGTLVAEGIAVPEPGILPLFLALAAPLLSGMSARESRSRK